MVKINFAKRIFGLDILRCFAIITVLYNHGYVYAQNVIQKESYTYFDFDGVSLFFVLSGFLIGVILINVLETSGASYQALKTFWIRRWFRTLPLYFLILGFITICRVFVKGPGFINTAKSYFLFLQNFYTFKTTFFITSWSLSVEEWFYLIIPIFLWGAVRLFKMNTMRALQFVIAFFIIFCPVLRYFRLQDLLASGQYGTDRFSFTVLCRLDAIMVGLTASYIFRFHTAFWENNKKRLLIIGFIIIAADYYLSIIPAPYGLKDSPLYQHVFHYSILPIAILLIMPSFNSISTGSGPLVYIITLFSVVSYSLYLIHNSIVMPMILPWEIKHLEKIFNQNATYTIVYISYWSISLFLAVIIYKYYEHPMTNLRDKLKGVEKIKSVKQAEHLEGQTLTQ